MEEKSRKPQDTPFKQQRLKSWQPILTPNWVIGTFAIVGMLFIPIGAILQYESDDIVEYSIQYDGGNGFVPGDEVQNHNGSLGCSLPNESDGNTFDINKRGCLITFNIERDMSPPIYVYYQLDNFYQNHRRYVASRSDAQLRGDSNPSTSECSPLELVRNVTKYYNASSDAIMVPPDPETEYLLNPCGLIANSMFNDIIWLNSIDDGKAVKYAGHDSYNGVPVNETMKDDNIAWSSDISKKFDNPETIDPSQLYLWQNEKYRFIIPAYEGQPPIANKTAWTTNAKSYGVKNEHFIVWMRTAGLPNFRKLYGRIDTELKQGTKLTFLVSSNFVVSTFQGSKYLVISTTSWFGGKNPFLGIAYITVGSICMVLALLFFVKHKVSPRKLGDTRSLVWKNRG